MNIKESLNKLKMKAKELKKNVYILYLAYKHSKTPWYAKVLAVMVVAYALSPIDLIPDFIPILGYIDDLIIVPAGISLSLRLIPKDVIEECRKKQEDTKDIKGKGIYAGILIILFWIWIIYKIVSYVRFFRIF